MIARFIIRLILVGFWWLESAADVGLVDYSAQCVSQSKISFDEAQRIQQGSLPSNQQGKCYISCVLKSLGVVDARGKLSAENANKLIDMYSTESEDAKGKTKQVVSQCAREANRARNDCEVSFRMMRCVVRKRVLTPQTRNLTIGLPQSITFQLPPLSFTLFSVG